MNCSENSSGCRLLICAVLVSLLLMCSMLGLFFFHQASMMKAQVVQGRRSLADYEANGAAKVNYLITNLQTFARSNPDLNPVLAKYGLLPGAAQPGAIAPAPKK